MLCLHAKGEAQIITHNYQEAKSLCIFARVIWTNQIVTKSNLL